MTKLKQQFKKIVETLPLSQITSIAVPITGGKVLVLQRKSATIAPVQFNNLHLVFVPNKKGSRRVWSKPLATITRKQNISSSRLDGYSIELVHNFDELFDEWADSFSDARFRKLYIDAHHDTANGGVEISFNTAKERMIEFGKDFPNDRNDVSIMDLKWNLFRKEMSK